MRHVLTKGHVGCPSGTRPLSSIIESCTRPFIDYREKGTLKVYPWLRRVLFKGHADYPRETWPPSSIIESSTCPIFDHREKGTFKVFPWLHRMLFKGHAGYPRGTRPPSLIVKSSTRPVSARKGNLRSLPLYAPHAPQGSCGLSAGNSASIFNHRIEYAPHL